jgi:hypothetical protein
MVADFKTCNHLNETVERVFRLTGKHYNNKKHFSVGNKRLNMSLTAAFPI